MEIKSTEKKENSSIEMIVEVPDKEFDDTLNKVYNKNKKNIQVPGFRKGKVPRKIFESMYGPSTLYEDAIEDLWPDIYDMAVTAQNLKVVAYPGTSIESIGPEGLVLKITVTVEPEATLGQYKGLTVPAVNYEITEQDIDVEMQPMIDRATRLVSVDRPAQLGDVAVIDFVGSMDGKEFEGGKGESFDLELGSHTFIPGFEDGVVGMSASEEKDIPLTFPKEYEPEFAGKDAVFHVTLQEVKTKELPELDDEFAKDVSEFETLEELRADLRKKLEERTKYEAEQMRENTLMRKLCENLTVEIPQAMIDYSVEQKMKDLQNGLKFQNISMDQYLQYYQLTQESLMKEYQDQCKVEIQMELALNAVAKAEGMEISDEDVDKYFEETAEKSGTPAEKLRERSDLEEVRNMLKRQRAIQLVKDSAVAEEKPAAEQAQPETEAPAEAAPAEEAPAEEAPAEETSAAEE